MRLALAAVAVVIAVGPGWGANVDLHCLQGNVCPLSAPIIGCDEYIDALQIDSSLTPDDPNQIKIAAVAALIKDGKCTLVPKGRIVRLIPGDKGEFTIGNSSHLLYLAHNFEPSNN